MALSAWVNKLANRHGQAASPSRALDASLNTYCPAHTLQHCVEETCIAQVCQPFHREIVSNRGHAAEMSAASPAALGRDNALFINEIDSMMKR